MEKINIPINLVPEGRIPFEEVVPLQLYADPQERGGYLVTCQLRNTSDKTIQTPTLEITLRKAFNDSVERPDAKMKARIIRQGSPDKEKTSSHGWQPNQVWEFTASFILIMKPPDEFNCHIEVSPGQ